MNHENSLRYWFRSLPLAVLIWFYPLARRFVILLIWPLLLSTSAYATFSIVAIDPATGELGIAVASRYFAVGAVVPWAEADVGAVATQANVNVGYGLRALELLKQGLTAQQVLDRLLAEDSFRGKDGRQIAVIDAKGNVAVFTGTAARDWKGHRKGATYSVQGNLLVGAHVVETMARVFEKTGGELSERLYAALKAGDDAGGDRRGRQSASILVVRKRGGRNLNNDRLVFINVDDHPEPMTELRRLLNIQLGINHAGRITQLLDEDKVQEALAAAEKAAYYAPNNPDVHLNLGFIAYLAGEREKALKAFQRAKQLAPDFQKAWEAMSARSAYKKVTEDRQFADKVIKELQP
jgi:uncharacterized Ntn-hydrolase superfamily protein